ncbi:MAG: hypothetical protein CVU05_15215 [Bacteroidetes bacterium HGW-Bacteroidetes-21]|nr:MAG: hypothetical protein CVU05_15215 [Bacteroidetes bacterium HGW-Bacteroidetes-21]
MAGFNVLIKIISTCLFYPFTPFLIRLTKLRSESSGFVQKLAQNTKTNKNENDKTFMVFGFWNDDSGN